MTREEKQAEQRLSRQVDKIMENRERRFMFLTRKDRTDDAICIGEEFYEWLSPDHANDTDLIVFYNEEELQDLYYQKKEEARRN